MNEWMMSNVKANEQKDRKLYLGCVMNEWMMSNVKGERTKRSHLHSQSDPSIQVTELYEMKHRNSQSAQAHAREKTREPKSILN
jgi:hypothetical protein